MESIIEGLAQYGPLGLWTASLLWMNWQQRKDMKEEEKASKEMLQYHQEQIVQKLADQEHLLGRAIEKIEGGLSMVREKYAEERMYRMKNQ